jgi:hypothetical protein
VSDLGYKQEKQNFYSNEDRRRDKSVFNDLTGKHLDIWNWENEVRSG